MKKIIIIALAVLLIAAVIASCSKSSGTQPPGISAAFNYSASNTVAPAQVSFTNTTAGAYSSFWDFGDGSTSSQTNPVHVYTTAGSHTVKLTSGGGSTTKVINISPAYTQAKITYIKVLALNNTNGSGIPWDIGNSPDLYFKITNGANVLLDASANRFTDIAPPVQWLFGSNPFVIVPLPAIRNIEFWDYDSPTADDFIGLVSLQASLLQNVASDPYPSKTTLLGNNGLSVEIGLQWQ